MPSRRPHTKTRHGCDGCKARKVRCGLERPICKNCAKRRKECSFQTQQAPITVGLSQEQASSAGKMMDFNKGSPAALNLPFFDLELMHHFTSVTCFTMTDDITLHPLWQLTMPKLAFSQTFLLHGLLSLSALHKRHDCNLSQRQFWTELARVHQQQALSTYIPLLQSINEGNCHALFAFGFVIGALSFAFLQFPDHEVSGPEFINSMTDVFDLTLGSTSVAIQGRQWLRNGELAPLMGPRPSSDYTLDDFSDHPRVDFEALLHRARELQAINDPLDLWGESGKSPEESVYYRTLQFMAPLFPRESSIAPINALIGWPVFSGKQYLNLVKKHDPVALIILAYYGACLYDNDHVWFLKGLGPRLVQAVVQIVDKEWYPYLTWAIVRTSSAANTVSLSPL